MMERVQISSDELTIEVLPALGGRLHRLRAFGSDVLRTPDELDAYRSEPFFWGGFVMAPWCNRVAAGRQDVAGARLDLASSFPDGTAIHGQVQALAWQVAEPGTLRVEAGGDGWPWHYEVTQRLAVDGPHLRIELELTNHADGAMPAGIGIHPWFRRPLEVAFDADRVLVSNEESAPEPEHVRGDHDLRSMREMPVGLDATWTALHRPDVAELRWPDAGIGATLHVSREGGYLCAASPAAFGAVAIEPQTHAPNGLRRLVLGEPGGLQLLDPGATLRLDVELAFYSR
jgi:aldose 1-epimerase